MCAEARRSHCAASWKPPTSSGHNPLGTHDTHSNKTSYYFNLHNCATLKNSKAVRSRARKDFHFTSQGQFSLSYFAASGAESTENSWLRTVLPTGEYKSIQSDFIWSVQAFSFLFFPIHESIDRIKTQSKSSAPLSVCGLACCLHLIHLLRAE